MKQDFTTSFLVDATPAEVFTAINDVRSWWTDDFKGSSEKLNDEFSVQFEDLHYSEHKLIEFEQDKKVAWLVTDSNLSFLKNTTEWNNTTNVFTVKRQDDKTLLEFTHVGLVPDAECYNGCTKGWTYFINGSLYKLLTEGKGTPGMM